MRTAMLQKEVDWRHWTAGAVVLSLLLLTGWWVLTRPSAAPTTAAPRGPQARMQDAPEAPPTAPGP